MSTQERQEKVFKLNNILSKLSNRSVTPCDADDASKQQSKSSKVFPANQIKVEISDSDSGCESFVRPTRLIPRTGLEDRLSLTRNLNALHMPVVVQSRDGTDTEEWNKFGSVTKVNYSTSSTYTLSDYSGPQASYEEAHVPGTLNLGDSNTVDRKKSVLDAYLYQDKDCNTIDAAWTYNFGIRPRDTCIVVQPSESIGIVCEVCKRSFDSKKSLKRHHKETHKSLPTLKMNGRNKLGVSFGKTFKGNPNADSQLGSSSDTGVVESLDGSSKMAEKQKKFGSKAKGDKKSKLAQGDNEATVGKNNVNALNDETKTGKGKASLAKNEATKADKKLKVAKLIKAPIKIVGRKGITISGKTTSLSKLAAKRPEVKAKVLMSKKILNKTMKLTKKVQNDRKEQGSIKNHTISGKEKIPKNVVEKGGKEHIATGKHSKSTIHQSLEKKKIAKIDDKKIIDEPYKCQECGMGFRNKTNLSKHTPIHLMMKYHCYRCNDVFLNMRSLTKHLALHEDEPPSNDHVYRCRMCSQGFKTSRQLRRHMTEHERMEGLVDTLAPKKGNVNKDLISPHVEKESIDKHSTYIDVKCGSCHQTFENYFRFKEHVLNKHIALGDLSLQCSKCDDIFTNDVEVRKHLIAAHKLNAREARATVRQKEADAVFLGLKASILEQPKVGENAGLLEQTYGNLKSQFDTESLDSLNTEASHCVRTDARMLDTQSQIKAISDESFVENKPKVVAFNKGMENCIAEKHSESVDTKTAEKEIISATDGENKSCFLEEQESRNILQALFIEVDGELCETGPKEVSSYGSNGSSMDQKKKDSSLENSCMAETPLAKMKQTLISSGPTLIQEEKRVTPARDIEVWNQHKETNPDSNDHVEQKIQRQAHDSKSYMTSDYADVVEKRSSADLYTPLSTHLKAPQPNEVSLSNSTIAVNFDRVEKFKELIKGDIGGSVTSIIGLPDKNSAERTDRGVGETWLENYLQLQGVRSSHTNTTVNCFGWKVNGPSESVENVVQGAERRDMDTDKRRRKRDYRGRFSRTRPKTRSRRVSRVVQKANKRGAVKSCHAENIERNNPPDIQSKDDVRGPNSDVNETFVQPNSNNESELCDSSMPQSQRSEYTCVNDGKSETMRRRQEDISFGNSIEASNSIGAGDERLESNIDSGESVLRQDFNSVADCNSIEASNSIGAEDERLESNIDSGEIVLRRDFNSGAESRTSKSNEGEMSSQAIVQGNDCDELLEGACAEGYSESNDTTETEAYAEWKSTAILQLPKIDTGVILKGNDNDLLLQSIVKDGESEIDGDRTEKDEERPMSAFVNDRESVTELRKDCGRKYPDNDETNAENSQDLVALKTDIKTSEIETVHGASEIPGCVERIAKELEGPREKSLEYDGTKMNRDHREPLCNNYQITTENELANVKSKMDSPKLTLDAVNNDLKGNVSDKSELMQSVVQKGETSWRMIAKVDETDTRLSRDNSGIFCGFNVIASGNESAKVQSTVVSHEPIDVIDNTSKENIDTVVECIESGVSDEGRSREGVFKGGLTLTELKKVEIENINDNGETATKVGSNEFKLGEKLSPHELDSTENISTTDIIQMSDFDRSIDEEAEETGLNEDNPATNHSSHGCCSSSDAAERNDMSKAISMDHREIGLRKKRKFADTSMVDQGTFLPYVRRKASISGEKKISKSTRPRKIQTASSGSHSQGSDVSLSFTEIGSPNSKETVRHSLSDYDQAGGAESMTRETVDSNIARNCETLTANKSDAECSSMNENPLTNDEGMCSVEMSSKGKSRKRGRPSKKKTKRKHAQAVQRDKNDGPNCQLNSVIGFATKKGNAKGYTVDGATFSRESDTGAVLTDNAGSNIPGNASNLAETNDGQLAIESADEHTKATTELSLPANTSSNKSHVCMSEDTSTKVDFVQENYASRIFGSDVSDTPFRKSEQKRVKRSSIARRRAIDASLIPEQGDLSSLIYIRRHAAVVGEEKIHGSAHGNKRHLSTEESTEGKCTEHANDDRPPLEFTDIESTNKRKKGKDGEPCFTHVKNKGQMDGFENGSNQRRKSGYMPLNHDNESNDHDSFPKLNSGSKFKCKSCGKYLVGKSRLIRHQREHERDLPLVVKEPAAKLKQDDQSGKLKCDFCSKTFNTAYYLGLHKKRHKEPDLEKSIEDERSDELFQCPVCKKSLSAKRSLTRHLKGHKERTTNKNQQIDNSLEPHTKKPSKQKTLKQKNQHASKK
eukprot:Seg1050.2 transcript_id=Seg1050.2/GoldUCD/mRNA.D3Y31 product="Zinc finger protein with KRAB and SCAN domains 3" protein_id=Seg1050.2/GoldUCD/D3Y31